ncbi:hypothetical protein BDK51DRAFT_50683 [Blyttiomyces helicus]|uniref:Uncharacterized protein n=1 Tax=Blyttiomyces helicus TaxID=388810 RepID=A0A4V1IPD8_9FUNG|nr:hypothetical protein BDK51DRAFT_50683 [Blyttiomyces helicus]|eukprot:RKO82707.1 hypothetical protein BDK51DRAFT_50683 [Blyttiomyces helicus]
MQLDPASRLVVFGCHQYESFHAVKDWQAETRYRGDGGHFMTPSGAAELEKHFVEEDIVLVFASILCFPSRRSHPFRWHRSTLPSSRMQTCKTSDAVYPWSEKELSLLLRDGGRGDFVPCSTGMQPPGDCHGICAEPSRFVKTQVVIPRGDWRRGHSMKWGSCSWKISEFRALRAACGSETSCTLKLLVVRFHYRADGGSSMTPLGWLVQEEDTSVFLTIFSSSLRSLLFDFIVVLPLRCCWDVDAIPDMWHRGDDLPPSFSILDLYSVGGTLYPVQPECKLEDRLESVCTASEGGPSRALSNYGAARPCTGFHDFARQKTFAFLKGGLTASDFRVALNGLSRVSETPAKKSPSTLLITPTGTSKKMQRRPASALPRGNAKKKRKVAP